LDGNIADVGMTTFPFEDSSLGYFDFVRSTFARHCHYHFVSALWITWLVVRNPIWDALLLSLSIKPTPTPETFVAVTLHHSAHVRTQSNGGACFKTAPVSRRETTLAVGNALKYFLAAQIGHVGVFHPEVQQSSFWLACFVVATLYQVGGMFMDWGVACS
jgi:hypothetical protein